MPSLKRDCTCALQRKAMSVPLRSRAVRSLRSMLLSKYREKWAGFAYFWGKDGGISLQLRLLAERVGFEPTLPFRVNTLSKRAPSATRPSLRKNLTDNSCLRLSHRNP